jgi:uncharacterized metal-binding protein
MENKQINVRDESNSCGCQAQTIVILPCSGGSNCGQIANQVAIKLTEEGLGDIYCLAGVGAHIEQMINTVKAANRIVAIDGCATACAKKIIEHSGIKLTDWICITDQGINKVHKFDISAKDITNMMGLTKKSLAEQPK